MPFDDYFAAQQHNLEQIRRLLYFTDLVEPVETLYDHSVRIVPVDTPPYYGQLLLICHKAYLSAAALIGRALPDDGVPITRRAIEAACLSRAIKHDKEENVKRWLSYERRLARWQARRAGLKPRGFPPPKLMDPPGHTVVEQLRARFGMLSDAAVHLTPEFFGNQNWQVQDDGKGETVGMFLHYFEPKHANIEQALVALASDHLLILELFNECLDGAFHRDGEWRRQRDQIQRVGHAFAQSLARNTVEDEENCE